MSHQLPPEIQRSEQAVIDEFIKELNKTTDKVERLLDEMRNHKIDSTTVKVELKFLIDQIKKINYIVFDDNSESVLTRLTLLENSIKDLKYYMHKDTKAANEVNIKLALIEQKIAQIMEQSQEVIQSPANPEGKWRFYIALVSGLFALVGTTIAAVLQYLANN